MKIVNSAAICCLLLAGCAKSSDEISASYVSPLSYNSYDCEQLEAEYRRVSRRAYEVSGAQDDTADNDAAAMGVGLILFWPALFFIASDDRKEELGRLKGELDAIEQASIQKKCTIADAIQEAREAETARQEERNSRREQNNDPLDN